MEYRPKETILEFFKRLNKTRWPISGLSITDDGQHILIEFRDGNKFKISETEEIV